MSIYTIVLFLHVSGAIGYFVGIGTWLFCLASLRRAQRVEQVRALTNLAGRLGPLFGISVLLILAAGLYMALTAWSLQTGWIAVALISLVLMAPFSTALIEPRRRAIDRLAREAPDGPLPHTSDICATSNGIKRKGREAITCKQQVAGCIQDAKTHLFIRDLTLAKLIGTRTHTNLDTPQN